MASSGIDWICFQFNNKNEGSEPGPCHFCQTPHPKRKVGVVSVPISASTLPHAAVLLAVESPSPPKPACICEPALFSGSIIDLSTQEAGQAAVSASTPPVLSLT